MCCPPDFIMSKSLAKPLLIAALVAATPTVSAEDSLSALKLMSLDELADLRVSTATHRSERLEDTAAAIHVLTAEDIRRSGATSLPELLRTVPGLNVARISATEWAVSARGFNNQFANKLLVMVDGRSVYTPFFSGVLWDELNIVIQDIERVEIVRGPGGSTWGANAVNGVINIITRHAEDTQGTLVSVVTGDLQSELVLRNGFKAGDNGHARVWAKVHQNDRLAGSADDISDIRWRGGRAGFRGDWETGGGNLMIEGESFRELKRQERAYSGAHVLGQWSRSSGGARDELRAYFNRFTLDHWMVLNNGARAELDTFDLGYRHHFTPIGGHNLIAGVGYRNIASDAQMTPPAGVSRSSRTDQLFSAFAEDTLALAERLQVTVGVKVEHNEFTGVEWQPSARMRWSPARGNTLWASVARAVRTPSIIEDSARLSSYIPPRAFTGGLPLFVTSHGNPNLDAERLIAYELGYRVQINPRLSFDASVFLNDYDRLLTVDLIGAPRLVASLPSPYLTWNALAGNALKGKARGFELSMDYRPSDTWRVQTSYSHLDMNLATQPGNTEINPLRATGESPTHQAMLAVRHDLRHDLELDLQARYVSALHTYSIPDYLTADLRLSWRATSRLDLALNGRNLIGPARKEFGTNLVNASDAYLIPREYYLTANLRF
jgi:iron complex outermembrane receptor protein